jgi:hypothetical protein
MCILSLSVLYTYTGGGELSQVTWERTTPIIVTKYHGIHLTVINLLNHRTAPVPQSANNNNFIFHV